MTSQKGFTTCRDILSYIFSPIDKDEVNALKVASSIFIGVTLLMIIPNVIAKIFVCILSIILCLILSLTIWMYGTLSYTKRTLLCDRIMEVFNYIIQSYFSTQSTLSTTLSSTSSVSPLDAGDIPTSDTTSQRTSRAASSGHTEISTTGNDNPIRHRF